MSKKSKFLALVLFLLPLPFFPGWWCGREAQALFEGREAAVYEPLANEVAEWVKQGVSDKDFHTGSWQFDGEWQFGTYQMAGLGLCQFLKRFPEKKVQFLPVLEMVIDRMLSPQARAFDARSWKGEDALDSLDGDNGHVAYLGYANLVLGAYREIASPTRFDELNDRISQALLRRLQSTPLFLLQTYPGEMYPVDNAAAIGSLGIYARVTGRDLSGFLKAWSRECRNRYIDPVSGLLFQAVDFRSGTAYDKPRGSGTALGAYFLSFADPILSRDLYQGLRKSLSSELFGFGAFREYPGNVEAGWGDIDSGPLIFGLSMSATGFGIASARIHGDGEFFRNLYAMGYLAGYPVDRGNKRYFCLGGPLGTAIMLAMTTAGETR